MHLIRLMFDLNLRLTCICSLLSDVNFARVVVTAEAEVSLMVPQIFLAPSAGTFGLEGPFDLLEMYLTLVRPHTEYASSVWDPHLQKDKTSLEDIQKFAIRM